MSCCSVDSVVILVIVILIPSWLFSLIQFPEVAPELTYYSSHVSPEKAGCFLNSLLQGIISVRETYGPAY